MKIQGIFDNLDSEYCLGKYADINIDELFTDSRKKVNNGMFFCIKGLNHNSHEYFEEAIENGAVAVVFDGDLSEKTEKYKDILFIKADSSRVALSNIAENFYGNPSSKLKVFGVTGTNGKTSISYLLYKILSKFENSAYNGTAGTKICKEESPYTHLTTPDTIDLVKIFKRACELDAQSIAIEVSSHALDMDRASAIDFDIAIYSNLSRDHLDYHGSMDSYREAKAKLFKNLKNSGIAIINIDDKESGYFIEASGKSKVFTYGSSDEADYRFDNIVLNSNGTSFSLYYENDKYDVKTNLVSKINVYNLVAAISAIHQSGKDLNDIIDSVKEIDFNIGRFQYMKSSKYSIIVDYAHTPDGFEKIFAFTDGFRASGKNVISVFGSAGKRDKGKRKIMGEIASKHSDMIILTEEDYRDEKPEDIAREIAEGFIEGTQFFIETDREKAIKLAIENAEKDDIVVILGKGNEDFLDRGEFSCHWDGDDKIALKYAES